MSSNKLWENTSNTTDLESRSDLRWKSSLSATEDDVQKFLARRHRGDLIGGKKEKKDQRLLQTSEAVISSEIIRAIIVTYLLPSGLHDGQRTDWITAVVLLDVVVQIKVAEK